MGSHIIQPVCQNSQGQDFCKINVVVLFLVCCISKRTSSINMIYDKKGSTFLNGGKAMKYIFLMLSLGSIPCCFAGKMYTPLEKTYKVACIAEHLKKGIGNYICD